jgi:hypothetical protein
MEERPGLSRYLECDEKFEMRALITRVIISEYDFIKKLSNCFYIPYKLDSRARIYVSSIPLNYQIDRFIREVVEISNVKSTSEFEFNKLLNDERFKNTFLIHKLDNARLSLILDSEFVKKRLPALSTNTYNIEIFLTLIQRLGSKFGKSELNKTIERGFNYLSSISRDTIIIDEVMKLQPGSKKLLELFNFLEQIKT